MPARRLDAVHAGNLGETGSTPTATGSRIRTTPTTRSTPPPLHQRPGCRRTPGTRSGPTTTPTGTSKTCSSTPLLPGEVGTEYATLALTPQNPAFSAPRRRLEKTDSGGVPERLEAAAGRYELGKRGVWTLAAVAPSSRLRPRLGEQTQLRTEGLSGSIRRVSNYAVDGDKDAASSRRRRDLRRRPLARMMGARGSISAGVFTTPGLLVRRAVAHEPHGFSGKCVVTTEDGRSSCRATSPPRSTGNLVLSNDLELRDIQAGMLTSGSPAAR